MAETVTMPKLGFDMAEGTLVRWVRHEGETVEKGQVLAEIETDKATVEVEAQFGGTILKHLVEQGSIVPVGPAITIIGDPGEKVEGEASAAPAKEQAAAPSGQPSAVTGQAVAPAGASAGEEDQRVKASPLARKMAAELGVALSGIVGTGPP